MIEKFLVIDTLSFSLNKYPIYIPIPNNIDNEKKMKTFTKKCLKELMKLKIFDWYHNEKNIVIDGFMVRNNLIYPNIST